MAVIALDAQFFRQKKLYDREQVTVSTSPIGGTASKIDPTTPQWIFKPSAALVEVVLNNIFYTIDGSTPSGTNGSRASAGEIIPLSSYQKVKAFRAVRNGGTDATIDISYYKE